MKNDFQDVDKVLGLFDNYEQRARRKYAQFMRKGVSEGQKPELVGGGLIRSAGGWHELSELRRMKIHCKNNERALGDSNFEEIPRNA